MKKNIAKKWIKVLKSKKYHQGAGLLKQTNCNKTYHCCLGVLCELYNQEMRKQKKKMLSETVAQDSIAHKFDNKREDLPIKVRKWAGLYTSLGQFRDYENKISNPDLSESYYQSLADMNDDGFKFTTIAKTIEENIENL